MISENTKTKKRKYVLVRASLPEQSEEKSKKEEKVKKQENLKINLSKTPIVTEVYTLEELKIREYEILRAIDILNTQLRGNYPETIKNQLQESLKKAKLEYDVIRKKIRILKKNPEKFLSNYSGNKMFNVRKKQIKKVKKRMEENVKMFKLYEIQLDLLKDIFDSNKSIIKIKDDLISAVHLGTSSKLKKVYIDEFDVLVSDISKYFVLLQKSIEKEKRKQAKFWKNAIIEYIRDNIKILDEEVFPLGSDSSFNAKVYFQIQEKLNQNIDLTFDETYAFVTNLIEFSKVYLAHHKMEKIS